MKKTLSTLLIFIMYVSIVYAQDRVQTLVEGTSLLGTSKQHITEYLKSKNFTQSSSYKNISDFKQKSWEGEFTYTIIFDKKDINKVVGVSWNEHIRMYNSINTELFTLNFKLIKPIDNTYTGILAYDNDQSNIGVTLIVKENANEVTVSIYPKNPILPVKKITPSEENNNEVSGFGETPMALRKFTNLIMPQDDGLKTGKIAVRIKINKAGLVIDATPGVKGTTLNDRELWQKCKEAILDTHLAPSETAPDTQIGVVVFNFKVK